MMDTVKLGALFACWYAFNIGYNIQNKKLLNVFPFPYTASVLQLGVGILYFVPLWLAGLRKQPKLTGENLKSLSPIATFHGIGHVATVVSLGAGAVSFTHIIKAAEPFFSVVMSGIFLKSFFPIPVYLTLLPVVAGVALASLSELSFSALSFGAAMASNLAFSLRAIFSKKQMGQPMGENMNAANLYAVLTVLSFIGLLPVALLMESPAKLTAGWNAAVAAGSVTAKGLSWLMLSSGLFYYLYNEFAFLCLDNVHPITHAVGNTIKRVVIILASVVVFGSTMTANGIAGSGLAIGGVLMYSLAKNYYDGKK